MREQELKMLHALARLFDFFCQQNDEETKRKTIKLIEKGIEKEVQIAFCGHFSAGKSSLINYMMGEFILPTSPIPTSANIVKLKHGANEVRLSFLDGRQVMYQGVYHLEQVKSFCKNGEEIEAITISSEHIQLPERCALLDTPGIDSTEDAHRISTDSTLHLADIILYVVDYNHVQSQENFLFLKDMQDIGKQVYFVVNQIDKHDMRELTFAAFQTSLEEALSQWDISVEEIFYTSLMEVDHPHNQVQALKRVIHQKLKDAQENIPHHLMVSARQLIDRHLAVMDEQNHELWQSIESVKENYSEADMRKYAELLQALQLLEKRPDTFEQEALQALEKLLKNVYLLTADTRELVRLFLESEQKDFKVGLLFSGTKTEAVRQERRAHLHKELLERKKTQLDWHLKNWADQYLKAYEIKDSSIIKLTDQLEATISMEWMQREVVVQSEITGSYVLNFSEKLVQHILHTAKESGRNWIAQVRSYFVQAGQAECMRLNRELESYALLKDALIQSEDLLHRMQAHKAECERILVDSNLLSEPEWEEFLANLALEQPDVLQKKSFVDWQEDRQMSAEKQVVNLEELKVEDMPISEGKQYRRLVMIQRLERAIEILQAHQLPDDYLAESLQRQKERLVKQTYTIALFGAFSAGKSSFANALLGKDLLPVSPNPTTAVINRVQRATDSCPSGTAQIFLKSHQVLLEELRPILGKWDINISTVDEAFEKACQWLAGDPTVARDEHAYFSFIKAFCTGFSEFQDRLGKSFVASYEVYCGFAIEEDKSCFVEEIILYYDCSFTKSGLVLVDTPGADSIHARHTHTSFQYIKDCDAMIYVTYYNHPFSRADQEFLIQLGRVKDAFALDKMFFVCNAIDLASSAEELQMVLTYIRQQLEGFSIRTPRLYGVSSREALKEQMKLDSFTHPFLKDSQFPQFQWIFNHFVANDLVGLALDASQALLQSTVDELARWIQLTKINDADRIQKQAELEREEEVRFNWINALQLTNEKEQLLREKDELCYYLLQRVFLRFSQFFINSFNPSLLKTKADIKKALDNLLEQLAFDVEQELRALSLRLEKFVCHQIERIAEQIQARLLSNGESIHLEAFIFQQSQLPEASPMLDFFTNISFQKELGLFKTPKRFFEMNEKKQMEEALKNKLQAICEGYLQEEGEKQWLYYQDLMQQEMLRLKKESENTLKQSYQAIKIILQTPLDLKGIENCYTEMSKQMKVEM